MPTAARRVCAQPGCPNLQPCAVHKGQRDRERGTSHQRGYGTATWGRFRRQFIAQLVELGITPCCGAALPDGPQTQDSLCKAEGLVTMDGLHLDHEPPLTEAERRVPAIVCDATRVQLLCSRYGCHSRKTRRQAEART